MPPQQPLVLIRQQRRGEPLTRLTQSVLDVGCDAAGLIETLLHHGVGGKGAVIQQQHDPQRRVLLQGGRPHRLAHDCRLFRIGRDEDGQAVLVPLGEVAVELSARSTDVITESAEGPGAGDEVHQGREREERHDRRVDDHFERAEDSVVRKQLREDREDHVADPGRDRRTDGDPRPHHLGS